MEISFASPQYLYLLGAVSFLVFVHFYTLKHTRQQALKFANFDAIMRVTGGRAVSKNAILLMLRICIITLMIFAVTGTTLWYEGLSAKYDMVLAIDSSSSMLANDYTPNRMEAAKNAAGLFIDKIKGDVQVGIVAFSGGAVVEQKPTTDMALVKDAVSKLQIQTLGGTDIGQAIVTSANLLQTSDAPKVIVLLTDGRSNVGMDPMEAIDYLGQDTITVFTVGIATGGGGEIEGVGAAFTIDEETLQEIAEATGGQYFHATSVENLDDAFNQVAQFQKKKIKIDLSPYLLLIAFSLLFIEWGLISTKYKII
ncbi:MAG: VWA domain-containing protein [archaeon]